MKWVTGFFLVILSCLDQFGQGIKIDHVIVAVHDLHAAVENFKGWGFTIKPGRLHANGLLNGHIKFKDGSELELMSVKESPRDTMALNYSRFLSQGEGGAYLALSGLTMTRAINSLTLKGQKYRVIMGEFWDYIVFPEDSDLCHVFLIFHHTQKNTTQTPFMNHPNEASHISQVWLDGSSRVGDILQVLGAKARGKARHAHLKTGLVYHTSSGAIVVVPRIENKRPRILAVNIRSEQKKQPASIKSYRAHGMWITINPD